MIKDMKSEKGFTLIEIAIVLVIGGIITSMLFGLVTSALNGARLRENNARFQFIQEEINRYAINRGRFPCPARLNVAVNTANFGIEIFEDCSTNGAVAGTFRVDGRNVPTTAGVDRVRIGGVPTRSLNLPDEYAFDVYGSRFRYAVTEQMASTTPHENDIGAIFVRDLAGANVLPVAGSAAYVLVSHGPNQSGGFSSLDGNQIGAGCTVEFTANERQNCNDDANFVSSIAPNDDPVNFFDDQVRFYSRNLEDAETIPTNAIVQFLGAVCPAGWTEYFLVPPENAAHIMCSRI